MGKKPTRRDCFRAAASTTAMAMGTAAAASTGGKPALLGGTPVRTASFPSWPVFGEPEEKALLETLRSGKWFRGNGRQVARFEEAYARLIGAKHCLATANGTSALLTTLNALEIGPGDEVVLPPYTFVACVNVILAVNALPVFVDTDRGSMQIDAGKIEAAITGRTRAVMAVHLGGNVFDVDRVLAIARKHKLAVIEDSCQAHLAEWKGRRTGTFGTTGCFSFQASKNLCSGEGGAILTSDGELLEKCYAFQNNSRSRSKSGYNVSYSGRGLNLRMPEFQGALLQAQMTRVEEQSNRRRDNGRYLTTMLREIPGIEPALEYDGCTRNAYHLYMFRYDKERFGGLSRARFIKALSAEGVWSAGGYTPLNKSSVITNTIHSRGYRAIYSAREIRNWEERNSCPENDRLCREAVWFSQNMLLGPRGDMDQIAAAIRKIHAHAVELAET